MDARLTSPNDWRYVSEGGATIVFSYVGLYKPKFVGTVLRLRKTLQSEISQEELLKQDRDEDEDIQYAAEEDDPTIEFQARIVSRLIPQAHLPRLESCRVGFSFLSSLSTISRCVRPLERVMRDSIDTRRRRAVLATDLVGAGTGGFAAEIKPKWAFLPNPKHLSETSRGVKLEYSRFVMHSHFRSLRGGAGSEFPSFYDPLDLFSGNEKKVKNSIYALWASWISSNGGANTLKIFVDGKTIKPTDEVAPELLSKYLADDLPSSALDSLCEPFSQALLPLLLQKPLLNTLEALQRTLDSLDIEGLSTLWARSHTSSDTVPRLGEGEPEPTLAEWESFVGEYLSRTRNEDPESDGSPPSTSDLRYHILAYLMSATFKDCSVIARFPPRQVRDSEPNITVIDLEPKSVARLSHWAQLDKEITEAYAGYITKKGRTAGC